MDAAPGAQAPLVTIGVPVRNGEQYLAGALDSLLAQTYRNLEILISDNASTDRTYEICQRYLSDRRVTLWRNEQNIGAHGNFDLTLRRASGKYFMWAAFDDLWSPQFVEALVGELEAHPEAGVAMTATERVLEGAGQFDVVRYRGKDDPNRMSYLQLALAGAALKSYYLCIYGLFRTEILRAAFARFPQLIGGDRLFFIQVALATRLRYVDEVWNVRRIAAKGLQVRYADDPGMEGWANPLTAWLFFGLAGPYLLRSPLIPWHRKLWIPLIVARIVTPRRLFVALFVSVQYALDRTLGPRRHAAVRRIVRRAVGLPSVHGRQGGAAS
jgi:glycosyltransferase involved in cell wall biosynthesis